MSNHHPAAGQSSTGEPVPVQSTVQPSEYPSELTSPDAIPSASEPLVGAEVTVTHDAAAEVLHERLDQSGSVALEGDANREQPAEDLPPVSSEDGVNTPVASDTDTVAAVIPDNQVSGVQAFLDDESGALNLEVINDVFTGDTKFQRRLRERTDRGYWRPATALGKFAGSSGLSYAPTAGYLSYFGKGLSESLAFSNLSGMVEGGLVVPGAGSGFIFAERLIASRAKAKKSNALSDAVIEDVLSADQQRRFWNDYRRELGADQENLIDEDGEEELLQSFHRSNLAGPYTTPYLGSRDNYARHCMLKMIALCGYAADGAIANGPNRQKAEQLLESLLDTKTKNDPGLLSQWRTSIDDHLARLTPKDRDEILSKHNIFETGISDDDKSHRLKNIRQTSIAYGRLLEKYHTERREAQVTGSIVAPAALTSVATASPVPLIGAGIVYGGRRLYRAIIGRKGMVNLEFDQHDPIKGDLHGRGGGPIIPASLARKRGGAGIYQHAILVQCAGKTQADLTEVQKYWYKHIDLHVSRPRYASTKWKKPEDLAVHCAAAVQKDLTNVKAPKTVVDQDKIRQAEEERRFAADENRHAQETERSIRNSVVRTKASIDQKKKQIQALKNSVDPAQIALIEQEISDLIADVARLQSEHASAEKNASGVVFSHLPRTQTDIDRARQIADSARSALVHAQSQLTQKRDERRKLNDVTVKQKELDIQNEIDAANIDLASYEDELKRASAYAQQTAQRLQDANEKVKTLKEEKPINALGLTDIGTNLDIQRAFAVKIQEEFAALIAKRRGNWDSFGKIVDKVTSSGPAKALGSGVLVGGASFAVAWPVLAAFQSSYTWPVSLGIGAFTGARTIYNKFMK